MTWRSSFILALASCSIAGWSQCNSPSVFITASTMRIGGTASVSWGAPSEPFAPTVLAVSDDPSPVTVPGVGPICLNVYSASFAILYVGNLDAVGEMTLSTTLPNIPSLTANPPLFVTAAVVQANGVVSTRSLRLELECAGGHKATTNTLGLARVLHTATALNLTRRSAENRVLITGGGPGAPTATSLWAILDPTASDTTELYDPLTRSFTPGPLMNIPRAHHRSVLMNDGRVLVTGGTDAADVGTSTCEIFDPAQGTLAPAASMNFPRAAHDATLLSDGRVLVTGGFQHLVGAPLQYNAAFATLQDTGEVYDPVADTWTLVMGTMSTFRALHRQHLLFDGRVLIISGIILVQSVSAYTTNVYSTQNCDYFDPGSNSFQPAPPITVNCTALGVSGIWISVGHGFQSTMREDGVITAGAMGCIMSANPNLPNWNWYVSGYYTVSGGVGTRFFHQQAQLPGGYVMYSGGFHTPVLGPEITETVRYQNGFGQLWGPSIGTSPGLPSSQSVKVAMHTLTELYDGSFLLAGGLTGIPGVFGTPYTTVINSAWVYTP